MKANLYSEETLTYIRHQLSGDEPHLAQHLKKNYAQVNEYINILIRFTEEDILLYDYLFDSEDLSDDVLDKSKLNFPKIISKITKGIQGYLDEEDTIALIRQELLKKLIEDIVLPLFIKCEALFLIIKPGNLKKAFISWMKSSNSHDDSTHYWIKKYLQTNYTLNDFFALEAGADKKYMDAILGVKESVVDRETKGLLQGSSDQFIEFLYHHPAFLTEFLANIFTFYSLTQKFLLNFPDANMLASQERSKHMKLTCSFSDREKYLYQAKLTYEGDIIARKSRTYSHSLLFPNSSDLNSKTHLELHRIIREMARQPSTMAPHFSNRFEEAAKDSKLKSPEEKSHKPLYNFFSRITLQAAKQKFIKYNLKSSKVKSGGKLKKIKLI